MRLAIRCARDSMPPLRLAIIDDLAAHPKSTTTDVRKRLNKPRNTVDRQLQALHMLGVLTVEDEFRAQEGGSVWWKYSLADDIDPTALLVPDLLLPTPKPQGREGQNGEGEHDDAEAVDLVTHIFGTTSPPTATPVEDAATDARNPAYAGGICSDCHTEPHSAGRPRCDDCHSARLTTTDGHDR